MLRLGVYNQQEPSTNCKRIVINILGTDQIFDLDVDPYDTIFKVKQRIQDKINISTNHQKLVFAGMQLHDSSTLTGHRICTDYSIHLIINKNITVHQIISQNNLVSISHSDNNNIGYNPIRTITGIYDSITSTIYE